MSSSQHESQLDPRRVVEWSHQAIAVATTSVEAHLSALCTEVERLRAEVERTTTAAEAAIDHANIQRMTAEAKVKAVEALVDEWANQAEHGEDERFGRIVARILRSCAEELHEALGACCSACKGTGHSSDGICWDCRGTGHPHPMKDDDFEQKPEVES